MHPVLKRIALNGLLCAAVLGLIGFMFAEMASMWMGSAPRRAAVVEAVPSGPAADPVNEMLRRRVPLMMATWGFLFVAVGEVVLYLWKGRRGSAAEPAPPTGLKPETAEVLLEDLFRQIEAGQLNPAAETSPASDSQKPTPSKSDPSTSSPNAGHSPTPQLVPGEGT